MVRALAFRGSVLSLANTCSIGVVGAANDQPTADRLTQRLDVHEETAWMLRSLLEDLPVARTTRT
jgi:starvation-inducible DNA-binding protein